MSKDSQVGNQDLEYNLDDLFEWAEASHFQTLLNRLQEAHNSRLSKALGASRGGRDEHIDRALGIREAIDELLDIGGKDPDGR